PRRSNSQNLLPRNPKPLREDRAQALVARNNIPKRSFQRPHIQLAAKPNRQRDRVAAASALQPLQKPQPTLPIPQRHLGRTLNRQPARKPTAAPAHATAAPRRDAHPHAPPPALHPPPPTAQPAPLPSALRTGCGSIPQHQGSNECG